MTQDTTQCVLFEDLVKRPVVAMFDEPMTSSDGGLLLLKAADRRLGLSGALAECLSDRRQPGKVRHQQVELLRERVFAIACGYPDGNDAARLADDPLHMMAVGREPGGEPLASQPTLSRFERAVGRRELMEISTALAAVVIQRHRRRLRRVRRITLDIDQTHDPTHGRQQLALFNGFYDTWCYLPLFAFLSFDDEAEQFLVAALLRPGNVSARQGLLPLLRRLLPLLRQVFPKVRIRVRLDAGFPSAAVLDFLETEGLEYVVALPKNSKLQCLTRHLLDAARAEATTSRQSARRYEELNYQARRWPRHRRVITKAEVVVFPERPLRDNLRFVVTNLTAPAQEIWERHYCPRGDSENRIKELKLDLAIDRTSCSSFAANQFRVLLTAAAYVLMQELRLHASRTKYANARVATLRDHLIKIGARVVSSVRRVVLHLPRSTPAQQAWCSIACSLGARAG